MQTWYLPWKIISWQCLFSVTRAAYKELESSRWTQCRIKSSDGKVNVSTCCHHDRITLSPRWPCQFFTEQVIRFKHPARYADQDSQVKWAASTVELWQFGDRPSGENGVCLAKTLQDVVEKCKAMCHKSTWPNTTTQNFSKTKTVNFYAKLCKFKKIERGIIQTARD